MEKSQNKYIAVAYKLYTVDSEGKHFVEEATEEQPFQLISGFGISLDAFENRVIALGEGETFEFQLTKDEAFGDYVDDRIREFGHDMFCINGHFDHEHIYKDAIVPIQNNDGNLFHARVLEITDSTVKLDFNAPLAGKTLLFAGKILENRDATIDEIKGLINRLSGEGCSCGCGDCGGGCGSHDDDCGHHHNGGCCGGHHHH
ncbi:FKBP-type peptidyl-prolyl cis-trans isomerase [Xylanibacter muris]|uniref:peptidylprolyl isomerase n=1 Tax=Xylanibacter muris TaxID=2736290 RepID=A0ABX2AR34_9BACT|nr:peptidylprolyl isomerase [Xylanibacter muris]NPD92695.1 peptidylprolyl isomerase [Xylanibacter muris]